jgi:hypothetical protein
MTHLQHRATGSKGDDATVSTCITALAIARVSGRFFLRHDGRPCRRVLTGDRHARRCGGRRAVASHGASAPRCVPARAGRAHHLAAVLSPPRSTPTASPSGDLAISARAAEPISPTALDAARPHRGSHYRQPATAAALAARHARRRGRRPMARHAEPTASSIKEGKAPASLKVEEGGIAWEPVKSRPTARTNPSLLRRRGMAAGTVRHQQECVDGMNVLCGFLEATAFDGGATSTAEIGIV